MAAVALRAAGPAAAGHLQRQQPRVGVPPRSRPGLGLAPAPRRPSSGACSSPAAETWMPSRADLDGARELAPTAELRYVPNVVDVAAIDAAARARRPARGAAGRRTSPTRPTARGSTSCSRRSCRACGRAAPQLRLTVAGARLRGARRDRRAGRRCSASSTALGPALRARRLRARAAAERRRLAGQVHRGARPRAAGGRHAARRRRAWTPRAGATTSRAPAPTGFARALLDALDPARGAAVGSAGPRARRERLLDRGAGAPAGRMKIVSVMTSGDPRRRRVRRRAAARRAGRARPRDRAADQPPGHRRRHARRRPPRRAGPEARLAHLAAAGRRRSPLVLRRLRRELRARGPLRRAAAALQEGAAARAAAARRAAARGSPGPSGARCRAPLRSGLPQRASTSARRATWRWCWRSPRAPGSR